MIEDQITFYVVLQAALVVHVLLSATVDHVIRDSTFTTFFIDQLRSAGRMVALHTFYTPTWVCEGGI